MVPINGLRTNVPPALKSLPPPQYSNLVFAFRNDNKDEAMEAEMETRGLNRRREDESRGKGGELESKGQGVEGPGRGRESALWGGGGGTRAGTGTDL